MRMFPSPDGADTADSRRRLVVARGRTAAIRKQSSSVAGSDIPPIDFLASAEGVFSLEAKQRVTKRVTRK